MVENIQTIDVNQGTKETKKRNRRRRNARDAKKNTEEINNCKTGGKEQKQEPCEGQGLTPYQGKRRTFGLFSCPDCRHQWSSGNSWANMGQQCLECDRNIYPHVQRPLKKSKTIKANKPHLESLCEKCKTLGVSCVRLREFKHKEHYTFYTQS